jgi:hypothetical protein
MSENWNFDLEPAQPRTLGLDGDRGRNVILDA